MVPRHLQRLSLPRVAWLAAAVLLLRPAAALAQRGVWISPAEIARLPASGAPWEAVLKQAGADAPAPNLADKDDRSNIHALAKALVYARTGDQQSKRQVEQMCRQAIGTEKGGRSLALGRKLCGYVVAADLVNLDDPDFTAWLKKCRHEKLADGRSLVETHEQRPNNWGLHCGASRLAAAIYLGEKDEIERVAKIFRGWLGDRQAYHDFNYGDLAWQADPSAPVGVNPRGAVRAALNLDGALPEEMRRGGPLVFPPKYTGYAWGALQGALVQAELLHRQGYDVYQWQDKALLRAVEFLYRVDWQPKGDDEWLVWLVNKRYATDYATDLKPKPGKNLAFTSWTHQ